MNARQMSIGFADIAPKAAYPNVYRQLMAAGLLGIVYRVGDDADQVHEAVELTLADATQYRLLRGLALGMGGRGAQAREDFDSHLDAHEDNDSIKVAIAVSLMLSGDPEGRRMIDRLLATSIDPVARSAAFDVLNYVRSLSLH